MTYAQRVATMALVADLNDPKFNMETFIERDDYFIGFEDQREQYYIKREQKRIEQDKMRDLLYKQRIEIQKSGLKEYVK